VRVIVSRKRIAYARFDNNPYPRYETCQMG